MKKQYDSKDDKNSLKKNLKRTIAFSMALLLAGSLVAGSTAYAGDNDHKGLLLVSEKKEVVKGGLDVSDIVEEAMPSVVTITTLSVQEVQSYYGLFGYGGYAPYEQEVEGGGSGIIIGKNEDELLIVTNYHVVKDATKVTIGFIDNSVYDAEVQGYDIAKDLAVVSVKLDDLTDDTVRSINIARVGSSDDLKVGEQVVAIGNALGYGQSVTTGIVSAKNRQMNNATSKITSNSSDGVNLIQTDAAINPGNSGGALLNMNGEVVGINSAKTASTYVEGMGYAIAISDVTSTLEKLMSFTSRELLDDDEHGMIGINVFDVSELDSQKYGFPMGAYVAEVVEGGAAEEAGIPEDSILIAFDGYDVSCVDDLLSYLSYYAPGETVEVIVSVREKNGLFTEETYSVTLHEQEKKDQEEEEDAISDGDSDREKKSSRPNKEKKDDEFFDDSDPWVFDEFDDLAPFFEGEESDDEDSDSRSREDIFKEWDNRNF